MIDSGLLRLGTVLAIGQQVKINHDHCKAGLDTKQRLYIKRVVGGVVGYCHHCNDKGFYRETNPDGTNLRKWLMGKEGGTRHFLSKVSLSELLITHLSPTFIYNAAALKWMADHWVTGDSSSYYSPSSYGEIIMKLYDPEGRIHGLQQRSFLKPFIKYMTFLTAESKHDAAFFFQDTSKNLVITEDYTSAYRVFRETGINSVALLKTSLSTSTEEAIKELSPKEIIIWLDRDKAGLDGARKLEARLRYVTDSRVTNFGGLCLLEPKQMTPDALIRRLHGL